METTLGRELVLFELERINLRVETAALEIERRLESVQMQMREDHTRLAAQISALESDVSALKVRATAWGVVGGSVATIVAYLAHSVGWPR